MQKVISTRFLLRGTPGAVVALLSAARAYGYVITRTKLAKLLYLADLRLIETHGRPGSGVTWVWWRYGPYSQTLARVEDELAQDGVLVRDTVATPHGSPEHRLLLCGQVPVAVDTAFLQVIESVIEEYGSLASVTLRDITYQTAPMQEAQREGKRGDVLDLLTARHVPDIAPTLSRLKRVLDSLEPQDDEPGALEELAREVEEWSELRRHATENLLE